MDNPWTEERIAELRSLHAKGYSATAIAREFGMTRNTVCGKIARLSLPEREVKVRGAMTPSELRPPKPPKPASMKPRLHKCSKAPEQSRASDKARMKAMLEEAWRNTVAGK